jgi:hypothetical protein
MSGVTFSSASSFLPDVGRNGNVTFQAYLAGTPNASSVWSYASGQLSLLAQAGTPIRAGALPIQDFSGILATDAGAAYVAYGATSLADLNQGDSYLPGIFSNGQLIALAGDTTPDGQSVFADFDPFLAANASGEVAFSASLDSYSGRGLFATDATGALHTIVRTGDFLTVAPGDSRQVSQLYIREGGGGNGWDGHDSIIDDAGQVAFEASFTDGSSGIFLYSPTAPVPEPGTLACCAVALLALSGRRLGRPRR